MKTSLEWLQEYADISVSGKELGDKLTMTGSKVETVEEIGEDIKGVVVGKIIEIQKHPDADKLVVTKVDIGNEILQIVTGASNIKENDIVPIAKDGSSLPNGIKIKNGKFRGIDSCGMMCSIGELGFSISDFPEQIEDGIMILPQEFEKKLGESITKALNLEETILDFEITPNRPDCLSVEGLGREVAVTLKVPFKAPHKNIDKKVKNKEIISKPDLNGLSVEIQAPDLCYRYVARIVENVKIGPSPEWLVRRLRACGMRSINNIVDITNYVMLEMGQPMHAFDINSIEGKHITVRRAKPNEEIITLDEQKRILQDDMLVIADTKKPVAIAGVMGGMNSEIEEDTKTVVFESAVFNGGSVRKTAKAVGLRTESSSRFEKGLSPENAERAVNRAVELVKLLGAGTEIEGKIDVYPTPQKENRILLEVERINNLLGINITKQEMISILESLEMKIEKDEVIPPYFRQDVEGIADIAEEILRFYGYDKLGSTLIHAEETLGGKNKEQKIEEKITQLLVSYGFSEMYSYGFMNEVDLRKVNISDDSKYYKEAIKIRNPLSEDYTMMKTTNVPSMMQMLLNNENKKNQNVALFDLTRTYRDITKEIENGELPEENKVLTLGIYGEKADFYILKGILENLLEYIGVTTYQIVKETENKMFHPGRCANLKIGNDIFATWGEIHPFVIENYDAKHKIFIAEININKIVKYARTQKHYKPVPKYPAVERDIAIVVKEEIEVGKIELLIQKKAKKLLEKITLFDVYRNEKLGSDKKSVAYSLVFRLPDRTLKDEEIQKVMEEIQAQLQKEFGAELRK